MMRYVLLLVVANLLGCQVAFAEPNQADGEGDLSPFDGGRPDFDLDGLLHSASKREGSDRQREVELAAQQPFNPYGRRTDVPGWLTFGKRGQQYFVPAQDPFPKRDLAEVNPYSVSKRDAEMADLLADEKRGGPNPYALNGLGSLSFGKRGGDLFRSYAFGKRALGSSFAFGKRGLSSFAFGKRGGDDEGALPDDAAAAASKRALGSSFSFGKRGGLSSFAFGKRAGQR